MVEIDFFFVKLYDPLYFIHTLEMTEIQPLINSSFKAYAFFFRLSKNNDSIIHMDDAKPNLISYCSARDSKTLVIVLPIT